MFKRLQALLSRKRRKVESRTALASLSATAPDEILIDGVTPFLISEYLSRHHALPILDWNAVESWIARFSSLDRKQEAWIACERAWLLHLRSSLGSHYWLAESKDSALLSSLEPNIANATLGYMDRTLRRVAQVLEGIARIPALGKGLLIVFDDQESYYRYVSFYYPEDGEYAFSGGMHISAGCSHYVTVRADLQSIEPVIAHEMTHGCVAHLPLPLWLNEGLAVNTEHRLAVRSSIHTPQTMREKHRAFWGQKEVQQFWSGSSFNRTDDGNLLSYDLARIMVEQLAKDWDTFKRFVLAADRVDAGALAAHEQLGVDLGVYVCALLEREPSPSWAPDPKAWNDDLDG